LSGFSQNSFEKWQMAACYFSKEFPVNPRNVSTNKKRGIALCCFQFTFTNSEGFGVKQLRTYDFNIMKIWRTAAVISIVGLGRTAISPSQSPRPG
jgi:hypothetical protein